LNNCQSQKFIFLICTFLNFLFPLGVSHNSQAESLHHTKSKNLINKNKIFKLKGDFLYSDLFRIVDFNENFSQNDQFLISNNQIENKTIRFNELFIESEVQEERNNTLIANGNVIVRFKGNILKADNLSYDRKLKLAKVEGNIHLLINNQIFKAEKIEYDFINQKGIFQNVEGLINAEKIISDLDFTVEKNNNPSEVIDKIYKDQVLHNPDKIVNWIFFAEKLIVDKNKWSSPQAFFTNDLIDTPQIQLQLNGLEVSSYEDKLRFKSKINYLILEDKKTIPFWFGDRTIIKNSEDRVALQNRWKIGYDNLNKDGLFIGRKLNSIKINDDLFLNIEPQFLFQRTLQGNTKSFVQKNKELNSKRVKRDISFSDFFALNSNIDGSIKNWDFILNKEINSFDFEKFDNALRVRTELSKKINISDSIFVNKFFGAYRDPIWNGSIGETEIYGAYGWQLEQENSWYSGQVKNNQTIKFGLGNYKAEELTTDNLITSYKGIISYQLKQKFPLQEKNLPSKYVDKSYKYIPSPIKKGAFINTKIKANHSFYDNGNSQQFVGFGLGPEIILGDFKRDFFDYTRISVLPFYKFKSGNSLFKFDQISEKFTLDLSFDQHLIGSWVIETKGTINLDNDSNEYGNFIDSKITINWKKRAYSFGLFYQPNNEAGGIIFSLNGFE